ncbi:lipocalin family protein [Desulfoluna sp.]|uniref:lipocalin family protein n=1 Tax=Desulfoluna sp. TaxID=2045199 RepID=UPI002612C69F|nr:lipocalin family protein [Desulfoluna sp.]
MKKLSIAFILFLTGCVGMPENVKPVDRFKPEKYMGTWYEIARLDHSFERGLSRVTADYSLRDDGGIRVLNRGYSDEENAWKEAEGKAYFVGGSDQGYLKVSFFGPFYSFIRLRGQATYAFGRQDHSSYALCDKLVAGMSVLLPFYPCNSC